MTDAGRRWCEMLRLLAGGEPVPLPACAGPCRVHRFPLVADDDTPFIQGAQGTNVRPMVPMVSILKTDFQKRVKDARS